MIHSDSAPRAAGWAFPLKEISIFFLLIVVAIGDILTGEGVSPTLLYAIPAIVAVSVVSYRLSLAVAVIGSCVRFLIMIEEIRSTEKSLWNTGILFATIFTVCTLINHLKALKRNFPMLQLMGSTLGIGIGIALALGALGVVTEAIRAQAFSPQSVMLIAFGVMGSIVAFGFGYRYRVRAAENFVDRDLSSTDHESIAEVAKSTEPLIAQLKAAGDDSLQLSRSILLGSRDPAAGSCINVVNVGQVQTELPANAGDYDGGPGTKLSVMLFLYRQGMSSAQNDYEFFQTRIKTYLKNQLSANSHALETACRFYDLSQKMADFFADASDWPREVQVIEAGERSTWPGYCLSELNEAIRSKNLLAARRWSRELRTATFALLDLHRWLSFLNENFLDALAFQEKSSYLIPRIDRLIPNYDFKTTPSFFPGGMSLQHNYENYQEVERQAERLFSMPQDRMEIIHNGSDVEDFSLNIMPVLREVYGKVRAALSPANQLTLDKAVQTPFEYSYLVNMLYRNMSAGATNELVTILKRFDTQNPKATVTQLMGALMYRAHSFAGVEWADRYHPELFDAAKSISSDPAVAFEEATAWTSKFYTDGAKYGITFTLRETFEQKKLDCVRATDMIGTLFRNAGHSGFGHVRWTTEFGGHSVAARIFSEGPHCKAMLFDGMNPTEKAEVWPDAYFRPHEWPVDLRPKPNMRTAELFVRGLDNYIWAEGYIVMGPEAGMLYKSAVPYLPHREYGSAEKVFDGPYPTDAVAAPVQTPQSYVVYA